MVAFSLFKRAMLDAARSIQQQKQVAFALVRFGCETQRIALKPAPLENRGSLPWILWKGHDQLSGVFARAIGVGMDINGQNFQGSQVVNFLDEFERFHICLARAHRSALARPLAFEPAHGLHFGGIV